MRETLLTGRVIFRKNDKKNTWRKNKERSCIYKNWKLFFCVSLRYEMLFKLHLILQVKYNFPDISYLSETQKNNFQFLSRYAHWTEVWTTCTISTNYKWYCLKCLAQKSLDTNELRLEKICLNGFRPGLTQTRLYNHWRWVETWNFGFRRKRDFLTV